jgi:hypothetical protein
LYPDRGLKLESPEYTSETLYLEPALTLFTILFTSWCVLFFVWSPSNEPRSLEVSSREAKVATAGCLLCSCLQVNCQINPIGQADYFCFAPAHQFSLTFTASFLSLPFLISFFSLSHSFRSVYVSNSSSSTHNVIRNSTLYFVCSLHFIMFPSHLPILILTLVVFPFFFTFIFKATCQEPSHSSSLSLPQVLFLFYYLPLSSFLCCFLNPLQSNFPNTSPSS